MDRPSTPTSAASRNAAATISRSVSPTPPRTGAGSTRPSGVAGRFTDVREEVEEGPDGDPVAHRGVDVVEELVQRLLRVPVGALEVRVVAPEHHVLVAHARHRLHRRLVVLERDPDLPVDELL